MTSNDYEHLVNYTGSVTKYLAELFTHIILLVNIDV